MKAITAATLLKRKFKYLKWGAAWQQAFGKVEQNSVIFIWGGTGNGKTTFVLQLVKELLNEDRALYNSLEEGEKASMQNALLNASYSSKALRRLIIVKESMEDFSNRLKQPRSPRIAVVDSVQVTNWKYADYVKFKQDNQDKLLIFISQCEKSKPIGMVAERIKFDADQKIIVEGFRAISNGRSNPGGIYTIWAQGAANYWGYKEIETNTLKTNTHEN